MSQVLNFVNKSIKEHRPLPKGNTSASVDKWFEDSFLKEYELPTIKPDSEPSRDEAIAVVKHLYKAQSDPICNTVAPRLIAALAYQCLLIPGSSVRIFSLYKGEDKYWKDGEEDNSLSLTAKFLLSYGGQSEEQAQPPKAIQDLTALVQGSSDKSLDSFPELGAVSDEDVLRYIGTWAFSLLRACVKNSVWLADHYSSSGSKSVSGVSKFELSYHSINNAPGLRFPAFSAPFYENLHATYKNSNPWLAKLALESCWIIRKHESIKAKAIQSILRGFLMISVMEFGMPLWTWPKRVSQLTNQSPTAIYGHCATAITRNSVLTGLKFIYKYMATEGEFKALGDAKNEVGDQIKSIYWWASRLLNTDWMGFLGHPGNADFIYLMIIMHDKLVPADKRVATSSYVMPTPLMSKTELMDIANVLISSYRSEGAVEEYSPYLAERIKNYKQHHTEETSAPTEGENPFD